MIRTLFHYLSYFRFALIGWGCFLVYAETLNPSENYIENFGLGMLLCGLGMSFDGLRDDTRVNTINKKIYRKEKLTKTLLVIWTFLFVFIALFSLYIIFVKLKPQLGYGILAFGIGGVTLMKGEYERFDLFRKNEAIKKEDSPINKA